MKLNQLEYDNQMRRHFIVLIRVHNRYDIGQKRKNIELQIETEKTKQNIYIEIFTRIDQEH